MQLSPDNTDLNDFVKGKGSSILGQKKKMRPRHGGGTEDRRKNPIMMSYNSPLPSCNNKLTTLDFDFQKQLESNKTTPRRNQIKLKSHNSHNNSYNQSKNISKSNSKKGVKIVFSTNNSIFVPDDEGNNNCKSL